MGMMTKMRDNAHLFIIAFAVVFIAFWVLTDVDVPSLLSSGRNELANIDGRTISYDEYQRTVENMVEQQRQQNQGKDVDENTVFSIREQVWNEYLSEAIFDRAAKDMGITVTDEEITQWVNSDNPPEELAKYFRDSTGRFNKEMYFQFLQNPGQENVAALNAIEKQLRTTLLRNKVYAALVSSITVPESEVRTRFADQTRQISAKYIFFDPRVIAGNDKADPTEAEYQAFYDKNKKQFKVEDMRKLKYVLFSDKPSREDTAAVLKQMDVYQNMIAQGRDFIEVAKSYSEVPTTDQWVSRQQAPPTVAKEVLGKPIGTVVGPIANENGLSLFKILEVRSGTNMMVDASHILLRTDGGQDEAKQKAKALEVLAKAKSGEDFARLAGQYSEEPGAAERGGSLGWFGKGAMVKEFEEAAFAGNPGQILGPVKTQFGFHIIKVIDKSSQEFKYAEIRLPIRTTSRTSNEIQQRAKDFAYFAKETGFDQEAKNRKLQVVETPEFTQQSGSYIPGVGTNPALLKFAFDEKVNTISDVYRAANGYVVAMVSGEREAGYRPLTEIKDQIKAQVIFERQVQKSFEAAQRAAKAGSSLDAMAATVPGLKVDTSGVFTGMAGIKQVGRDEAMLGILASLKPGQISRPFKSRTGAFIVQLEAMSPFDEAQYKAQKDQIRQQLMQAYQQEFFQNWFEDMKKTLPIEDYRDRFYR